MASSPRSKNSITPKKVNKNPKAVSPSPISAIGHPFVSWLLHSVLNFLLAMAHTSLIVEP
jgi:hypothetical protein